MTLKARTVSTVTPKPHRTSFIFDPISIDTINAIEKLHQSRLVALLKDTVTNDLDRDGLGLFRVTFRRLETARLRALAAITHLSQPITAAEIEVDERAD